MRITHAFAGASTAALLVFGATAAHAGPGAGGRNCPPANPVYDQTNATCYPTIQSAVNAASPGDIVVAEPGTYHENVSITKDNLTLESRVGAGATTIVGDLSGVSTESVVAIDANGVTLGGGHAGFTIQNSSIPEPSYDIHGVGIGFNSSSPSGVTVDGNVIDHLVSTLPATGFGRVDGIAATNTTNAAVTGNTIGPWTVALSSTDSNVFTYGVLFFATNVTPSVTGNTIAGIVETGGLTGGGSFGEHEGVLGIAINDSTSGANVAGNSVSRLSSAGRSLGVSASEAVLATTVDVTGNRIDHVASSTGSSAGVVVNPGTATTAVSVDNNRLAQNGYGIVVAGNASGSSAHYNDFITNPVGVADADGAFDATNNWWGCSGGPTAPGCDTVIGSVTYTPWLARPAQSR
jgi:hypothetical protein